MNDRSDELEKQVLAHLRVLDRANEDMEATPRWRVVARARATARYNDELGHQAELQEQYKAALVAEGQAG